MQLRLACPGHIDSVKGGGPQDLTGWLYGPIPVP
jgi:hypothetical protein